MDTFEEIFAQVNKQMNAKAQQEIDSLKARPYNRIHLTELLLQNLLGGHVVVNPKDEYLQNQVVLDSIINYFIQCVNSVSLCEGEVELLIQFSNSLRCEGNYIDQLFKDCEDQGFDFNKYQLGKNIKYLLDHFKSDLYKETI